MKVLIIGASGFLGCSLMQNLSEKFELIGTYSTKQQDNLIKLNAVNKQEVKKLIENITPNIVIDLVGISSVPLCEIDPETAKRINYLSAKYISDICRDNKIKLIFISSVHVFDGEKGDYNETDIPNAKTVYGKTKALAEREVLKDAKNTVIRLSGAYGFNGHKRANALLNEIFFQDKITIKNPNQIRQPIYLDDFTKAIELVIEKKVNGIVNIAGTEKIRRQDFVKKLAGLNEKNIQITMESYGNSERLTLNIDKLIRIGLKPMSINEAIKMLREKIKLSQLS